VIKGNISIHMYIALHGVGGSGLSAGHEPTPKVWGMV